MQTNHRVGRLVGALILAQILAGVLVNFVLKTPALDDLCFLSQSGLSVRQSGLAALAGLAMVGVFLAVAVALSPLLHPRFPRIALTLVALATLALAVAAVEQLRMLSMASLADAFAGSDPDQKAMLRTVGLEALRTRQWAHYLGRVADATVLLTFYLALHYSRLVPRLLADAGIVAGLLQLATLSLPFLGYPVVFPLLAPMGLCQLVLAIWGLIRGFRELPAASAQSDA